jgi:type VI secretion system protein ImpH
VATESGTENTALERSPIREALAARPCAFGFFQAVRLLARIMPARQVVGRFNNPSEEGVRFGANPALAFPASEIQSLELRADAPAQMRVNFMGLTGPLGALPLAYSELVLERLRERDPAMRDFYDIFNHRAISLFYQAWEKYRFEIPYERLEHDRFSRLVLALIGLGTPGLEDRQEVPDDSLLFYGGLLGAHARSAVGLRQLLGDYFDTPVEIEQFMGAWRPVEEDSQCSLGETGAYSEQLGMGAVIGDETWDQQSRVRIRLGPLTLARYREFLPGAEGYRRIRALTAFYVGDECDVELQLILRRDDVPRCELAAAGEGPLLGWTSWVKNAPFPRDASETVLEL